MPFTIHHYFPLGSDNVGDLLVARAIRTAFARHLPEAQFVDMPLNDRYTGGDRPIGLCGENLQQTNREADLVIVGGSNLLEPRKPPRQHCPGEQVRHWGVFTDAESIRRLVPPLLLLGMGTGSGFGRKIRPYHPLAREEIRRLFERSLASAVRDVTTVRRLAKIGVDTICTGCPVTYLTGKPVGPPDTSLPLVVSFPPSRIVRRRGGRSFMRSAMQYVEHLKRLGVRLVVTLHETRDRDIVGDWLPSGVKWFQTDDVDELVERYEASCGVIGFRLHAALLGLGLGRPVIPVGVDWRALAFIETFELQKCSIRAGRFGQFRKLRRLTDRLLAGDNPLIEALSTQKAAYLRHYESFLSGAAARLRGPGQKNELSGPAASPGMVDPQPSRGQSEKRVA